MIASMIETFSEAFTILRKADLNHKRFLEIMVELFGSPVYQNYGTVIAEQRFDTPGEGFGLKLGFKDIRLVSEFADSVQAPMPLATLIRNHFLSAMANGQESLDWSSLELVLARAAGLS
jgi:3-hydroxyisobutyrate dehydrogenase-like beta-hydroxyacid dehydrogenase